MATTQVVQFHEIGGLEVLRVEEIALQEPAAGEIQIRVHANSLNRADMLFREGQYLTMPHFPSRLGQDAAGVIEKIGEGVTGFAIGDTVVTIGGADQSNYGVFGETAILPAEYAVKYPSEIPANEAASLIVPYLTAWAALVDYRPLQAGETVLITAASSSVGTAAIQIANERGAIPIAVTRGADKREALLAAGAKHVIVTNDEDIVARTKELTGGKGADVAFDPVAGKSLESLANAMAYQGVIFLYGSLDQSPTAIPLMPLLVNELVVRGFNVYGVYRNKERLTRALTYLFEGYASGHLKPVISETFALEDIQGAFRYLESNTQVGRVVVIPTLNGGGDATV